MESVWWVFKQLWDKGLVYQGEKVVPVSTALGTPLSNFEATQNYVDVQDPAVTVLFKLKERDAYVAAWTTTPWTLPSNLAVCVGPDIDYVLAHDAERGIDLYLAEARLSEYGDLEVKETLKGRDLLGLAYEPLFPYFADQVDKGAFVVVMDDYVTTDSGTGIVHQAPAFGEDDYRVLKAAGITAFANPVTLEGRFTDEVSDFAGQYVKDADKEIIQHLKSTGALYVQDVIQHAYPYCYRSDTAAHLPRDPVVVRARHRHPRPPARQQQPDPLGARSHPAGTLRQVARRLHRLGRLAQPRLGVRRCRSGSTTRQATPSASAPSPSWRSAPASPSTTCTASTLTR